MLVIRSVVVLILIISMGFFVCFGFVVLFLFFFNLADCLGSIEKEFILDLLENNVAVWLMSTSSPFQHIHTLPDKLDKVPDNPVPSHLRAVTDTRNTALYIFTSGSTGEDMY